MGTQFMTQKPTKSNFLKEKYQNVRMGTKLIMTPWFRLRSLIQFLGHWKLWEGGRQIRLHKEEVNVSAKTTHVVVEWLILRLDGTYVLTDPRVDAIISWDAMPVSKSRLKSHNKFDYNYLKNLILK